MTMSVTPRATPSAARLEPHTVTGSRILVVDDDPAFGDSTARVLRAAGFEVYLAPDHRLALEDLESTRPIDLLITDIVMPDRVNGLAADILFRSFAVVHALPYDASAYSHPSTLMRNIREEGVEL